MMHRTTTLLTLALAAPLSAAAAPAQAAPATAVIATVATPSAGSPAGIGTRLATVARSRYLSGYLSAYVVDRATGDVVWSQNAARTRMPASTQKLLTAYTVLHTVGPSTRITTTALQSGANPGNVYLRGGGDPTLTRARLAALARAASTTLKAQGRTTVNLYLDDTAFPRPTLATGWKSSYLSEGEVQPVRALTLDGYRGADGTLAAGSVFRGYLKSYGVNVRDFGRGTAPAQRDQIGSSASAGVGRIVGEMLRDSVNDDAEYLLRFAALQDGRYPTWSAAIAHERDVLARGDIPTDGYRVYDGSGLSRSDRMPVRTLAATVAALYADEGTRAVVFGAGAIPRAGQTGTLSSRFHTAATRCAAGKVLAKTGTLGDVVGLAGIARGADGRDRIFAFLENGRTETAAARNAVDTLAAATVGCR